VRQVGGESVGRAGVWPGHAGIVDQQIEPVVPPAEMLGEGRDVAQGRESAAPAQGSASVTDRQGLGC